MKKTIIFSLYTIFKVLLFITLFLLLGYHLKTTIHENFLDHADITTNYIRIYEKYSLPGYPRYNAFIHSDKNYYKLKNFYADINKQKFRYQESKEILIQSKGYWNYEKYFIKNNDAMSEQELPEFVNQLLTIDGASDYYTNVNGIAVSLEDFESNRLKEYILSGTAFEQPDFLWNQPSGSMKAILGYEYMNRYKLNDKINILYMTHPCDLEIVGFFKKGTTISLGMNDLSLDYSIIIPSFDIAEETFKNASTDDKAFFIMHVIEKCCGNIYVDRKEDVVPTMKTLRKLFRNYHLKFTAEPLGAEFNAVNAFSLNNINLKTIVLVGLYFTICLFSMYWLYVVNYKYTTLFHAINITFIECIICCFNLLVLYLFFKSIFTYKVMVFTLILLAAAKGISVLVIFILIKYRKHLVNSHLLFY